VSAVVDQFTGPLQFTIAEDIGQRKPHRTGPPEALFFIIPKTFRKRRGRTEHAHLFAM
jgi:hypothetical protein